MKAEGCAMTHRLGLLWRVFTLLPWLLISAPGFATDQAIEQIIEAHWTWTLQNYPEWRLEYGDRSGNRDWTDLSLEAMAKRNDDLAAFARDLTAIEPAGLSAETALNREMLLRELNDERERFEQGLHLIAIDMRSGPQHRFSMAERLPFETEADYRDWLARLEKLPAQLAQYEALLQEGINRDRVQAQIIMSRVPDQIARVVADDATQSPFYGVFVVIPDAIPSDIQRELQDEAKRVINNVLNPAYRDFGAFISDTYLPASRSEPGIGSLKGGKGAYQFLASSFTTTDLTPEEIHQIGLDEVARIRTEMEQVIEEVGFEGDIKSFNQFLRSDPQFYYNTPEELLEGYQAVSKRLDPELVKLFGKLPRAPYGVRPIPADIAPDTTTAYYMQPSADGTRPGWYYVNLHKPEVRPKFEMEVLSVHESVPGHHLQIALAQELGELPEFRRNSGVTAFVEGWGLYSERLGYDMGLYQDPYSRYGQLVYDMWRAVRLVVDTGMHYKGWTRQQAIDFFKDNAAKTEQDIVNEIDRYISWPGQALAYKIGQLKMLELRRRSEQALGDDFDVRAFHDALLGGGALPLEILETRMNRWLAAALEKKNSS